MVFGNKGDRSGTGVVFTRNPSTGAKEIYGEYLAERPGRGRRRRHPHAAAGRGAPAGRCPRRTTSCSTTLQRLEENYRDMQDTEFTVEDGVLYMLQTRAAKRTAAAALKAAVDMVDEGLISQEEAVRPDRPEPARPAAAPADRPRPRRPSRSRRA